MLAILIIEMIPAVFIYIFTDDTKILALGTNGLRTIAIALVFAPFPMLAGTTHQAVGKITRVLVMYAANLVFLLPSVFIMANIMGIAGVWWAYVIANAAAAILALIKVFTTGRIITGMETRK